MNVKIDKILGKPRESDYIAGTIITKGDISAASGFPTVAEVQNGWTYHIAVDVTDNDATKTNTGLSFLANDEIAWNGTTWMRLGQEFIPQVTHTLYVDGNRTDTYTATGSKDRPYKTIMAAVNAISAIAPASYYCIDLASGTYAENIVLEHSGLKYLVFNGNGYVNINPASGNALQSTATNANLFALYCYNIVFAKGVALTGSNGATSFSDVIWKDCKFTGGTVALTCINNFTLINPYSEVAFAYSNVNRSWINAGQLQGDFTFTMDDTADLPSQGKDGTILLTGCFMQGTPSFTIGGTATYTFAPSHCGRIGTNAVTVPAGVSVIAYASLLRGTWTNNSSMYLRNSNVQALAGTAPNIDYQPGSQIKDDSSYATANIASALNGIKVFTDTLDKFTKVLYVDGNRADTYTANGSNEKPYKTIAAATAVATTGMLIKTMHATYAENVILPDGVSLEGYASNKTIINGNLTTTASTNMSIRYIQVTGNNTVTLNSPTELIDCYIVGAVVVNNVVTQCYNTFIVPSASGVVPLTVNGASAKHRHFLSTIAATGDTAGVVINNGTLILDVTQISNSGATATVSAADGQVILLNSWVINLGGGSSISIDNGATTSLPNALANIFSVGNIVCGSANTVVEGRYNISGSLSGSALIFGAFSRPFTSADSTGFAWTDNTLAVTHNLGSQYVTVDIYDNNDINVDYTVTATSTTIATISFPISIVPITGTWHIRISQR